MKSETSQSRAPREDLERRLALQHHDPHSTLGAHPDGNRVVVRAFRPGASRVELLVDGEARRTMLMTDPARLFEAEIEGRRKIFPYRLAIHYPGGASITIHDPYSFVSTLGDLDLHLWSEQ